MDKANQWVLLLQIIYWKRLDMMMDYLFGCLWLLTLLSYRDVLLAKLKMSAISTYSINLQRQHLRSIKVSDIVCRDDPLFYLLEPFLGAYGIQGPESYLYTSRSGCLDVDGINDVAEYSETIVSIV